MALSFKTNKHRIRWRESCCARLPRQGILNPHLRIPRIRRWLAPGLHRRKPQGPLRRVHEESRRRDGR
jgi:hypothetical protein